MEFLRVTFNDTGNDPGKGSGNGPASAPRSVIANGAVIGPVNTTLMLQANFYEIKLSGMGYAPPLWSGDIAGTLPTQPMVIVFT